MNPGLIKISIMLLLCTALSFACGSENSFDQQVAMSVASSQTALALKQPAATPAFQAASPAATIAATETFVPLPSSTSTLSSSPSYQPMSGEDCNTLQIAIAQSVGFPGNIQNPAPFTNYINQKTGTGCLVSFSLPFSSGGNSMDGGVISALEKQGWIENNAYAAAGPAELLDGFQKGDGLCLLDSTSAPADAKLCPKDSNYYRCLGNLQPFQVVHNVTLNCANPVP